MRKVKKNIKKSINKNNKGVEIIKISLLNKINKDKYYKSMIV